MNEGETPYCGVLRRPSACVLALLATLLGGPAWCFEPDELIRDTRTGLEWLVVSASVGRSYDDLVGVDGSNEFAAGGDFAGFRHATSAEVDALLLRAAIDVAAGMSVDNFVPVQSLQLRFGGPTLTIQDVDNLFAITETETIGEGIQDRFLLALDHGAGSGRGVQNGGFDAGAASPTTGSFLVREADPLPQRFAYVTGFNSLELSVIDAETHTAIDTIQVGRTSWSIAVSPDQRRVYTVNGSNDSVSVIDTATRTLVDTFDVGVIPRDVVTSIDGQLLFVSHRDVAEVHVLDAKTGALVEAIPVGQSSYGLARSPDGSRIYVSSASDLDITVIDVETLTAAGASTTNSFQFRLDVGELTGNLYSARSSTLYESDPVLLAAQASVPVGLDTRGVAVSERIGRVFTSSNDEATLSVVDIASFGVLLTLPTGATPSIHNGSLAPNLSVTAAGDLLYIANGSDDSVSAIDTLSNEILATIPVSGDAMDIVFVPEPSGWAHALSALCTVFALRAASTTWRPRFTRPCTTTEGFS